MTDWRSSLPQGALLVSVGGDPVAEYAAGLTGGAGTERCGPRTRFQVASISKQFTAAAVLVLVQRGRLALDDQVKRWFPGGPGGPEGWAGVTVHHLLSHTSGLGHWDDFPEIDVYAGLDGGQLLATVLARPLLGAPGQRFRYSSLGFCLLARIVEEVFCRPYAQVVTEELLEPAGLADTFTGCPSGRSHVASGHTDGVSVPSYELDLTGRGAGDIYSTVTDLDRWNRQLPAVLLDDTARRLMFTGHAAAGDSAGTWGHADVHGYGCFLSPIGAATLRYHSGHNSGFNSFSGWVPERELSVAILTNDDAVDPMHVARAFLAGHCSLLE
jgi:CubicO group peptidase (beta-lactamase class C family)